MLFGRVRFQEHTHTDTLTHEDTPLLGAKERVEEGGERETHCDRVKKTKTTREGRVWKSVVLFVCLVAACTEPKSSKSQKQQQKKKLSFTLCADSALFGGATNFTVAGAIHKVRERERESVCVCVVRLT